VSGYGFFLFSAALGASIRFHATTRMRDIEQAELRQRHELARDLHDTIGHHMSGIVIQAQAGQALAASHPDRALAVLETIEDAATRALAEMRTIVGVLRVGAEPDLAPQPGLPDIERLAHTAATPTVEVYLSGLLDDLPTAVSVALYRIAQEALTNARRHARYVTRVTIESVPRCSAAACSPDRVATVAGSWRRRCPHVLPPPTGPGSRNGRPDHGHPCAHR
jgi:signal transduction histidine kinase